MKLFRILAHNGDWIGMRGDFETVDEAKAARLAIEELQDRDDPTWYEIVPLLPSLAAEREG